MDAYIREKQASAHFKYEVDLLRSTVGVVEQAMEHLKSENRRLEIENFMLKNQDRISQREFSDKPNFTRVNAAYANEPNTSVLLKSPSTRSRRNEESDLKQSMRQSYL